MLNISNSRANVSPIAEESSITVVDAPPPATTNFFSSSEVSDGERGGFLGSPTIDYGYGYDYGSGYYSYSKVGYVNWTGSYLDGIMSGYKWNLSQLTFAIMPGAETAQNAIRWAMYRAEEITGLDFVEVGFWQNPELPVYVTPMSGFDGYASYPSDYPDGGDIYLNANLDFNTAYGYHVTVHELGHALGLKHPDTFLAGSWLDDDDHTAMSYNYDYYDGRYDFGWLDQQALDYMY